MALEVYHHTAGKNGLVIRGSYAPKIPGQNTAEQVYDEICSLLSDFYSKTGNVVTPRTLEVITQGESEGESESKTVTVPFKPNRMLRHFVFDGQVPDYEIEQTTDKNGDVIEEGYRRESLSQIIAYITMRNFGAHEPIKDIDDRFYTPRLRTGYTHDIEVFFNGRQTSDSETHALKFFKYLREITSKQWKQKQKEQT